MLRLNIQIILLPTVYSTYLFLQIQISFFKLITYITKNQYICAIWLLSRAIWLNIYFLFPFILIIIKSCQGGYIMSNLFRIYTDLIGNLVDTFLFFRFIDNNISFKIKNEYKAILFCIYIVFSLPKQFPFSSLISIILDFAFLLFCIWPQWKLTFLTFIKYKGFSYFSLLIILAVHSFVFNDYNVIISSDIYEQYKLIIIAFLSYTVYVL